MSGFEKLEIWWELTAIRLARYFGATVARGSARHDTKRARGVQGRPLVYSACPKCRREQQGGDGARTRLYVCECGTEYAVRGTASRQVVQG